MKVDPMHKAHEAPRCQAHSKRTGEPCKAPAVRGKKVCRMHGGKSPGGPRGERHGRYKHGNHTIEAVTRRRELREMLAGAKASLMAMTGGDCD